MIDDLFKTNVSKIPQAVLLELEIRFPHSMNIEWSKSDSDFEAIFYLDEIEHIARFSPNGNLLEYKKNLKVCEVPEIIQNHCKTYGEIMSAIIICSGDIKKYEIITQKPLIVRSLLLFSQDGKLIEAKSLPGS